MTIQSRDRSGAGCASERRSRSISVAALTRQHLPEALRDVLFAVVVSYACGFNMLRLDGDQIRNTDAASP